MMNSEAKSVPLQEVVNGICWSYRVLDDGTAGLVGKPAPRPAGDLEFPARLGGRPVTRIGDAVLHGCAELASVTVPEGVVVLGAEVFYGSPKLRTLRVQPGDAERIREVLEEWASAEVSFNYVFEES